MTAKIISQIKKPRRVAVVISSILLSLNIHAQCQSPLLIQQKGKIKVIDNFQSQLYQWINIHKADTFTVLCATPDPAFINPMPGDKVSIKKYCHREPIIAQDGIPFILLAQARIKETGNWVYSNTIIIK